MDQLVRWRRDAKALNHVELAEKILEESGYTAMWQQAKTADAPTRLENLKELITAMAELRSLQEFLEHVALVLDVLEADTQEKVTLMTLHAAAALNFPLFGCQPGRRGCSPASEQWTTMA